MLVRSLKRTLGFQFGDALLTVHVKAARVHLPDELREDAAFQFALKHDEIEILETKLTEPAVEAATHEPAGEDESESTAEQSAETAEQTEPETTVPSEAATQVETVSVPEPQPQPAANSRKKRNR